VSGRGVTELVRAVRARLDALPAEEESEDDLVDRTQQGGAPLPLPGRRDAAAKIGEFTIEADLSGPRVWLVQVGAVVWGSVVVFWQARKRAGCLTGWMRIEIWLAAKADTRPLPRPALPCLQGAAIERFAQMTDWGYYEAARRFQRVLVAAGIDSALRARGALVGACAAVPVRCRCSWLPFHAS
jgi:hypothetical protein